jgi:hypothetical protein
MPSTKNMTDPLQPARQKNNVLPPAAWSPTQTAPDVFFQTGRGPPVTKKRHMMPHAPFECL